MNYLNNRTFIIRHLILPIVLLAPILIAFELTNWDIDFQRLFYRGEHTWMFNHTDGWVEIYLHDGAKLVTHLYADAAIAIFFLSFRVERFKPFRKDALFVFVATALATGIVAGLKDLTNIDCPIRLSIFDGSDTYVKIFQARIPTESRGICWPAGHASAGFAFMSAYFVVRRWWPRYKALALTGGIGMGLFYGGVRITQGQHFLSHVLWSGIICWVIIVAVAMVIFREKPLAEPTSNP